MKYLFILLFSCGICLSSDAQNPFLIGKWNKVQVSIESKGKGEAISENRFVQDATVLDLFFMADNKFKQTRKTSENGTMDTQEGTWKATYNKLSLFISWENRKIELNYNYKLTGNILILERSNSEGTMKIVSTFRKKWN